MRHHALLATVVALVAGSAGVAAAASPQDGAPAPPRYAFCHGLVNDVYYFSPIYRGQGGDEEEAAFSAILTKARGGEVSHVLCSSRGTAPEAVEVRDRRFAERNSAMTPYLPTGVRIADLPEAATPRPPIKADGSAEHPLILECTTQAGQFTSMTQRYERSSKVLVKIAGPQVSLWKASLATWIQHPCVTDTRNGQFCSIAPTRIWIKDSYELTPGAEENNELDIDRGDGSFRFRNTLATPGVAPYVQSTEASGACRPTREPAPPSAPPKTAF
jgi:hypothetical protein